MELERATEAPWSLTTEELVADLETDTSGGLTGEEAERRLESFGPNELRKQVVKGPWEILASQFRSIIVLLLASAAVLSFLFGGDLEGLAIIAVLLINAAIGFAAEYRAETSMEALRRLGEVEATVVREGRKRRIPAQELVPGDLLVVDGGDVVTADARIVEASRLQADESALTGESVPEDKSPERLPRGTELAERTDMLYKGTSVTRGSGRAVVVSTGMDTELGRISSLVEEASKGRTPLEVRLDLLGRRLVWVTLLLASLVAITGVLSGKDPFLIVETAIALAVAAIPEGLPIVATLALARGMWKMAQSNALVKRLSAVESLGSTNVILTDKTGTLTENRMEAVEVALHGLDVETGEDGHLLSGAPGDGELLRRAMTVGVLCNNATLDGWVGDPTELALLDAAEEVGIDRERSLESFPRVHEESFDPDLKAMATVHRDGDDLFAAVKGAPEELVERASRVSTPGGEKEMTEEERQRWRERIEEMAGGGLRLIALARREMESPGDDPYTDLTFVGIVGLLDPPREEVRQSIAACHEAGIEVVMVTGDHALTARRIAEAVGLADDDDEVVLGREIGPPEELSGSERERLLGTKIFARTTPEQKMDLLALHRGAGRTVAMIGDGVNDAPALKISDIGVSMGQRGTQVAQEASDMVLKDDRFGTIVNAVKQGRVIFNNIRKFVVYLLSCNVSEILVVSLAILASAPLPILPLQILYLNLITDVFPALALGFGEGERGVMERPPRDPGEQVLTDEHWRQIVGYGSMLTVAVLTSLWLGLEFLGMEVERATTVSFLVLAFAQLVHVFNMAGSSSGLLVNEVSRNRYVWGAVALSGGLLVAGLYLPVLSEVLRVVDPGPRGWLVVVSMSLLPLVAGRLSSLLDRRLGLSIPLSD